MIRLFWGAARQIALEAEQMVFLIEEMLDLSSLDQLGRQIGILSTQWIVGSFVQLDTVTTSGFKAETCNAR